MICNYGGKDLVLVPDKTGSTALHLLCKTSYSKKFPLKAIMKLLSFGGKALVMRSNGNNCTAIELLSNIENPSIAIIKVLMKVGGNDLLEKMKDNQSTLLDLQRTRDAIEQALEDRKIFEPEMNSHVHQLSLNEKELEKKNAQIQSLQKKLEQLKNENSNLKNKMDNTDKHDIEDEEIDNSKKKVRDEFVKNGNGSDYEHLSSSSSSDKDNEDEVDDFVEKKRKGSFAAKTDDREKQSSSYEDGNDGIDNHVSVTKERQGKFDNSEEQSSSSSSSSDKDNEDRVPVTKRAKLKHSANDEENEGHSQAFSGAFTAIDETEGGLGKKELNILLESKILFDDSDDEIEESKSSASVPVKDNSKDICDPAPEKPETLCCKINQEGVKDKCSSSDEENKCFECGGNEDDFNSIPRDAEYDEERKGNEFQTKVKEEYW